MGLWRSMSNACMLLQKQDLTLPTGACLHGCGLVLVLCFVDNIQQHLSSRKCHQCSETRLHQVEECHKHVCLQTMLGINTDALQRCLKDWGSFNTEHSKFIYRCDVLDTYDLLRAHCAILVIPVIQSGGCIVLRPFPCWKLTATCYLSHVHAEDVPACWIDSSLCCLSSGSDSTQEKVKELVASMNIQFDNLCQVRVSG